MTRHDQPGMTTLSVSRHQHAGRMKKQGSIGVTSHGNIAAHLHEAWVQSKNLTLSVDGQRAVLVCKHQASRFEGILIRLLLLYMSCTVLYFILYNNTGRIMNTLPTIRAIKNLQQPCDIPMFIAFQQSEECSTHLTFPLTRMLGMKWSSFRESPHGCSRQPTWKGREVLR